MDNVKITNRSFDCKVQEYGDTKSYLQIDVGYCFEYGWVDNSQIAAVGMLFGGETL